MVGRNGFFVQQFVFLHHLKGQGEVHLSLSDGFDEIVLFQENHFQMNLWVLLGEMVDGISDECGESEGGSNAQIAGTKSFHVF